MKQTERLKKPTTAEDIEKDAVLRLIARYKASVEDQRSVVAFVNLPAVEGAMRAIVSIEADILANKHRKS